MGNNAPFFIVFLIIIATFATDLMMARFFSFSILWLLMTVTVWSIPAQQKPFIVTNSDGTQLTIMLCGDECCHFYATLDGVPVVEENNGDWRLAPELTDSIHQAWSEKSSRLNLRRQARAEQDRMRRAFGYPSSYKGQKKGIVLLVNFSDKNMKSRNTPAKFNRQFNQIGYQEDGMEGSVHDYFFDQSYEQFDLTFDIFGPIKVKQGYAYYGKNDQYGDDSHVGELTAEVCRLANQQYDINWADYDWDGDHEVDQVLIIYAGNGEHAGMGISPNAIWPHESSLTILKKYGDGEGAFKLKGYTIDTYAMTCECRGANSSVIDGIGAACHEFSHCLGLPDFYDTSGSDNTGMQAWDIMASGDKNGPENDNECPSGFTAYERWFAGWLEPIELNEPTTITDMPCLHDQPVAYIIYNDGNRNEYFLLENRQNKGWYRYLRSYTDIHGLLITHVDYDRNAWVTNCVNNERSHQRMAFIPAGKTYATSSAANYRSHLFPGSNGVTELTNDSHTSHGGKLFNKNTDTTKNMNKPITDIQEHDGLISFKFMGGGIPDAIENLSPCFSENEEAWYTLDGVKLTNQPTTPGLYLKREEGHIHKVMMNP